MFYIIAFALLFGIIGYCIIVVSKKSDEKIRELILSKRLERDYFNDN